MIPDTDLFRKCAQAYVVGAVASSVPAMDAVEDIEHALSVVDVKMTIRNVPQHLSSAERALVGRVGGLPLRAIPLLYASLPALEARNASYYATMPTRVSEYDAHDVLGAYLLSCISECALTGSEASVLMELPRVRGRAPLTDEDIDSVLDSFGVPYPGAEWKSNIFNDTSALVATAQKPVSIEGFARRMPYMMFAPGAVPASCAVLALDPGNPPVSDSTWDTVEQECRQRVDELTKKE